MKLYTNRFLLSSSIILILSTIVYHFWLDLGFTSQDLTPLISAALLSYLLSIVGFIIGIFERRAGRYYAIIGLIGNGIIALLFSTILVFVFTLK